MIKKSESDRITTADTICFAWLLREETTSRIIKPTLPQSILFLKIDFSYREGMEKKKKFLEVDPLEQTETPKEILKELLKRVKEDNDALDDHMGTIIGNRDRPIYYSL